MVMRRRFILAALVTWLVGAPLWAQHSGHGGMPAGSHGGFVGQPAASPVGRSMGSPSFATRPVPMHSGGFVGSSWGQWSHPPGSFAGSTWGHWPHRPFPVRYPYYWRWSYPTAYWWGAWSAYYPGFWYGNAGSYADTYSYPAASYPVYPEYAAPDANASPDQQDEIERLIQQVSRLQDQQDQQALSTARRTPAATARPDALGISRQAYRRGPELCHYRQNPVGIQRATGAQSPTRRPGFACHYQGQCGPRYRLPRSAAVNRLRLNSRPRFVISS